jgi:hypothetical protein
VEGSLAFSKMMPISRLYWMSPNTTLDSGHFTRSRKGSACITPNFGYRGIVRAWRKDRHCLTIKIAASKSFNGPYKHSVSAIAIFELILDWPLNEYDTLSSRRKCYLDHSRDLCAPYNSSLIYFTSGLQTNVETNLVMTNKLPGSKELPDGNVNQKVYIEER